jgi:urease accessory protein
MTASRIVELMRVLQFGDSTLPVGAFAFSNGLESAVQTGIVVDVDSLDAFVRTALAQAASGDGVALVVAHRAATTADLSTVIDADRAALRRKPAEEQRAMSTRMGKKFAELAQRVLGPSPIDRWLDAIRAGETPGTYPAGVAVAFAHLGLPARDAFATQQYGIASLMLGAALRLMRISHLDTQALLFRLSTRAADDFARIEAATLDDMCSFAPLADVLAAHHVKAHVRMFMN